MYARLWKVLMAAGLLGAVGVGVWNAVELTRLREQLAVKPTPAPDPPKVEATTPAPKPAEYVIEPPDVVRVTIKLKGGASEMDEVFQVKPDGYLHLGKFGSLSVGGLTSSQVKVKVEEYAGKFLVQPDVNVDVVQFNSKGYYVVTDFGGNGEQVVRLPATGNDTVTDGIAAVGGLSKDTERKVWIARPTPHGVDQILPVDWTGITTRGHTRTNYQLLPNDRLCVKAK